MHPDKYVNSIEDVPEVEHWAIISTVKVNSHKVFDTFIGYEAYLTMDKLLLALKGIESGTFGKKPYKVVKITPMKVTTTLSVSV